MQPVAILVAAVGLGWAFVGLSGLARHVGDRLTSPEETPWRAHLRGSIVLSLAFLFPILGWLLVFPISLILGSGAASLALFTRPPKIEEKVEVPA